MSGLKVSVFMLILGFVLLVIGFKVCKVIGIEAISFRILKGRRFRYSFSIGFVCLRFIMVWDSVLRLGRESLFSFV